MIYNSCPASEALYLCSIASWRSLVLLHHVHIVEIIKQHTQYAAHCHHISLVKLSLFFNNQRSINRLRAYAMSIAVSHKSSFVAHLLKFAPANFPGFIASVLMFLMQLRKRMELSCSTSSGVFSRYSIYIFPRDEASLSCLRLTQGVTPTSTTRLYRGYVNWG
jgi:hypothetical protein